jgi:hypothetical protein
MKKKENGKFPSFFKIRKYKDGILVWATSMAWEWLPTTLYEEIEKYLKVTRKNWSRHGKMALSIFYCSHGQFRPTILFYGSGCWLSGILWLTVSQSTPLVFTLSC